MSGSFEFTPKLHGYQDIVRHITRLATAGLDSLDSNGSYDNVVSRIAAVAKCKPPICMLVLANDTT